MVGWSAGWGSKSAYSSPSQHRNACNRCHWRDPTMSSDGQPTPKCAVFIGSTGQRGASMFIDEIDKSLTEPISIPATIQQQPINRSGEARLLGHKVAVYTRGLQPAGRRPAVALYHHYKRESFPLSTWPFWKSGIPSKSTHGKGMSHVCVVINGPNSSRSANNCSHYSPPFPRGPLHSAQSA